MITSCLTFFVVTLLFLVYTSYVLLTKRRRHPLYFNTRSTILIQLSKDSVDYPDEFLFSISQFFSQSFITKNEVTIYLWTVLL